MSGFYSHFSGLLATAPVIERYPRRESSVEEALIDM
jgi:hypothetical protein